MRFINTFRGRLMLILAILLVATLGFQYYLNLVTQKENIGLREAQEQSIVAGISLGFTAMTSKDQRVQDLMDQPDQTFLDENAKERIRDIIIIDDNWQVTDSLNPDYLPTAESAPVSAADPRSGPASSIKYKKLSELTDLPPLMEAKRLGEDLKNFPNQSVVKDANTDDEAHAIPIETSQGRWYVMILLKNDRNKAAMRAAQPLLYTLGILLVSSLITLLLVWRFSRPIADLSAAARQVAGGDLSIRVRSARSNDELGRLAENFNEMTAELERKREIEARLQQAEKSAVVGRLGSAIAHEIRNPLNYINLTLDHLRSKFAPAEPDRKEKFEKLTAELKNEVARINQQITDFLNYSRPATADLRPADIRKIIEDSLRIVEAQALENDIKIAIVERESVPQILGDPEFLRSVFNNLFINAVQAMGNSCGNLSIKILPEGSTVRVEIADTGKGIPAENLAKIFEPYFSTKETGTGLGLAIVHKIMEIHNGTIEVQSEIDHGTKFILKFPTADGTVVQHQFSSVG